MKPYVMSISPDFKPDYIAGWYIFNTWLQRQLSEHIHLELYPDFTKQRQAISQQAVDLVYANPFDAAMLVREQGFTAIAAPICRSDEAVIAVQAESSIRKVEDLQPGIRIACLDNPDVNLIAMIMLEPADLDATKVHIQVVDTYVLIAKKLLQGKVDIGFFPKEAYDSLSRIIKSQLREIVHSEIQVIRHVLLAGPRLQHQYSKLKEILPLMARDEKGRGILNSLGMTGWEVQGQEETEFMIDLMDTLVS